MVPFDLHVIRVFLHVLAATIWVGGQFVLAGLLPTVRQFGDDAPAKVARAFNRLAWPAFGVLVVTGIWNLLAIEVGDRSSQYHMVLGIKILVVALAGMGSAVHIVGRSKVALAIGGSVGALGSLAAVLLGVWLSG